MVKSQTSLNGIFKLIEFGAVYISDELEEDFQLEPNTVKHKMKRIRSDVLLPAGSRHYVRAHVNPRRFLAAGETRWMDCILKETDDFVVVMKPSGLPVSPSVDNAKENVLRLRLVGAESRRRKR